MHCLCSRFAYVFLYLHIRLYFCFNLHLYAFKHMLPFVLFACAGETSTSIVGLPNWPFVQQRSGYKGSTGEGSARSHEAREVAQGHEGSASRCEGWMHACVYACLLVYNPFKVSQGILLFALFLSLVCLFLCILLVLCSTYYCIYYLLICVQINAETGFPVCPITKADLSSGVRACIIWPCGFIVSNRAIEAMTQKVL